MFKEFVLRHVWVLYQLYFTNTLSLPVTSLLRLYFNILHTFAYKMTDIVIGYEYDVQGLYER